MINLVLALVIPVLSLGVSDNNELKSLANYQLTDKQYACHNKIVYKESKWVGNAVGNLGGTKQAHGYYQMKTVAAINANYEKQFYLYWYYVSSRYGITVYDEPDMCKALLHLKNKGWQ